MSHLDLLLPFGLPPKELARDILRALDTPALATLLGKGQPDHSASPPFSHDAFSRSLPHERWLGHVLALSGDHAASSPPVAPFLLNTDNRSAAEGWWFILQPAHLHIALDHLVLTDWRTLNLDDAESCKLFEAAAPLFEEIGMPVRYIDAMHWLVRADAWQGLRTATPDSGCGRNIDIWMPEGEAALAWRKLQNEVQMTWFAHPIQEAREARGLKPVNSLWLWGGGAAHAGSSAGSHDVVYNLDGALQYCATSVRRRNQSPDVLADMPCRGLLVADELAAPALAGDWAEWIAVLNRLEARWFAPMLEAIRQGQLASLTLILGDSEKLLMRRCTRFALKKFWLKPSLAGLTE